MLRQQRTRNWMCVIGLASLIYGFGNLYQPTVVVGESMAPTLRDGRVIWIDRTYYRSQPPRCGEVVVFRQDDMTYVKRVYRGPGETVRFIASDGQFLLPVRDQFFSALKAKYERGRSSLTLSEVVVPQDSVFVLGDNFSASVDSRQLGAIPIDSIIGRAHLDANPATALKFEFVPEPGKRYARKHQRHPASTTPEERIVTTGPVHPSQQMKNQAAIASVAKFTPMQLSQR